MIKRTLWIIGIALMCALASSCGRRPQSGARPDTLVAPPPAAMGAEISYTLPRDAKVTINLLDANGWIVRELIRSEAQTAGAHSVHWDGCDQLDRPLPPGQYSWKLLHHTGLKADYVLSVANSGQPPYRTNDDKGSWGGCHGNPISARADASGLYLTWTVEEGNAVFTKADYDGKAIFKIHASQGFGRNYDSAVVGDVLYRIESGGAGSYLLKYDATGGKYVNWEHKAQNISGGRLRVDQGPPPTTPEEKKAWAQKDPQTLAANDKWIAVAFPTLNKVALYRPTGEPAGEIAIDQPRGMTFLPDGRLAVAHGKEIAAINPEDRKPQTLLAENLDSPFGITVSQDAQSLWITDQGQNHQVKQFTLAGKLLKSFGKAGGTPTEGKIDHDSFYMPRGIACGTDGNIYVTEDNNLRRISRWSADGKLLREWFGPLGPQKSCWPNMANFSEVYYHTNGGFVQCQVDLEKKTWYPVSWYKVSLPNSNQPYIFEYSGRKFLYDDHSTIYAYDARADRWQPAMKFWTDKDSSHLWTDANGNGQPDEGETQSLASAELLKTAGVGSVGISMARIDPASFVVHAVAANDLVRLEPAKFTDSGLPVYAFDKIKRLTATPARAPDGWAQQLIYAVHTAQPAADGGVFTSLNGGRQGGVGFWDRASWNYLMKFGPDGKLQWRAGVHQKGRRGNPADLCMLFRIDGISHGLVFLTDVEAQFHAYTDDGLYVDRLMDIGERNLSPNSLCVENITGLVVEDPKTKEPYLFAGSTEDARVFKLAGYDSLQRMDGKVTLASADIPAKEGPADQYTIAGTQPPRKPDYLDAGAEGYLSEPEWKQAQVLPIVEDGILLGKVYLRYDDKYLWVGAYVHDPSPAVNATQDAETALIRGDCIDLYFGADPKASAQRNTGGVGDVRVVLYPTADVKMYNGAMVAIRTKVSGDAPKKPFEYRSPVSDFTADSVTPITGKDEVTKGGLCTFNRWADGHGYTCEAKIPLTALPELGIPAEGQVADGHKIAFDAGIIYSNVGGTDRAARVYWHQNDANTHTTTDLPTEAQLYPRLWGTAVIGPRP